MKYNFICSQCGEFELNISSNDLPLTECPHCHTPHPEKIFEPPTAIGIWRTDGAYSKHNHQKE